MPTFDVRAPLAGFTGTVAGVEFAGGTAQVDTGNDAGRAAYAYFERAGYRISPVEDEAPEQAPAGGNLFDPSEHNADEVMAYLESASLEEAERVVQDETDGKARKGILTQSGPLLASKEGENL